VFVVVVDIFLRVGLDLFSGLVKVRNSLSLEGFPLKGLGRRALMRGG
jgi:hypothetical protein